MKIIKANAEYLDSNKIHPYKFMERIGRICYKSENKITKTSGVKFVNALFKNKHTAMLEHSHIILSLGYVQAKQFAQDLSELAEQDPAKTLVSPYFNITTNTSKDHLNYFLGNYVSGSFRSFINLFENNTTMPYENKCIQTVLNQAYPEIFKEPTNHNGTTGGIKILSQEEFIEDAKSVYTDRNVLDNIISKHIVHTVLFTCDRGVTHEFVRHRPASFAQESTRYCNYSQSKYNHEITVIEPCFYEKNSDLYNIWKTGCEFDENTYFTLLSNGATAQQARDSLPTSVKTELVITANEIEWQHIINLRFHGTTGTPHPQMQEVMAIAYPLLVNASGQRLK